MSVPKSRKQKKQPSQKCPKCEPASPAATEDLTDEEEEYSEEEKKVLLKYGLDIDAERRLMEREPTEMRRLRLWRARCRISFEMNENKKQLRNRYHGALLGLAAGDALGTTLEFKSPGTFRPLTDMVGGGPFNLQPGQWTDDTSMALCLGASLARCNGFDPKDQMQCYCRWWQEGYLSCTGRCFDIGITVAGALSKYQKTSDPFAGLTDPYSAGNFTTNGQFCAEESFF
jgi:hypothetical protein